MSSVVNKTKVSIIVAAAKNGVIGRGGDLPWRLSADLKRFKRITTGHPIVMGRKTWESIGKPLPGRTSIVVSRQLDYTTEFEEVRIVHSLEQALELQSALPIDREIFLIGGAQLYEIGLPLADHLYYTHVDATVEGDVTFPKVDWSQWLCIEKEEVPADDRNDYAHTFAVYERVR